MGARTDVCLVTGFRKHGRTGRAVGGDSTSKIEGTGAENTKKTVRWWLETEYREEGLVLNASKRQAGENGPGRPGVCSCDCQPRTSNDC